MGGGGGESSENFSKATEFPRFVIGLVDVFQGGDQSGAQIRSPRHVHCGGSVQQG